MFVIKLDFNIERPYYVCRHSDGGWDERYCPVYATSFDTESEALRWMRENTTFGDYAHAVNYGVAVVDFMKWAEDGMIRRQFEPLNKTLSRKYNAESTSAENVLDWRLAAQGNDNIRYEDYETWPQLYTVFCHLFNVEFYYKDMGDYSKGFSKTVSVRVSKSSCYATFKREIDLILPKIDYVDDHGDVVIDVFDHYLSEGGNFVQLIRHTEGGTWSVKGRWSSHVDHASLKTCFDYIQNERYYA